MTVCRELLGWKDRRVSEWVLFLYPPPVTGSSATMRRAVSSSGASKIAIPVLT